MDRNIFNSDGRHVAIVRDNSILDLKGKEIYKLKGKKIYKLTGERVGHLNAAGSDMRLEKSSDRLFSK
jgi:sporulation protein YlmC with PRC-barrel domain